MSDLFPAARKVIEWAAGFATEHEIVDLFQGFVAADVELEAAEQILTAAENLTLNFVDPRRQRALANALAAALPRTKEPEPAAGQETET